MTKIMHDIIPPERIEEKSVKKIKERAFNLVKNYALKITLVLLILSLNWAGFSAIVGTFAYFSKTAVSPGNTFSFGNLALSLHSGQDNFVPTPKAGNMKPGDKLTRVIQVRNEGSLPFQYTAKTEKVSGDNKLCNALQLKAKLEGKTKVDYEGGLMGFTFNPLEFKTPPGIDTWQFKLSLPEDAPEDLEGKFCKFNFVFEGWQLNFADSSFGFSDTIEVANFIETAITAEESTVTIIKTSLRAVPGRGIGTEDKEEKEEENPLTDSDKEEDEDEDEEKEDPENKELPAKNEEPVDGEKEEVEDDNEGNKE